MNYLKEKEKGKIYIKINNVRFITLIVIIGLMGVILYRNNPKQLAQSQGNVFITSK